MSRLLVALSLITSFVGASLQFSLENLNAYYECFDGSWEHLIYAPNDESFEVYSGKKSAEDRFDPFELVAPFISQTRIAELEGLYLLKSESDSKYCKAGRSIRPQGKCEWLYFMQHYSEHWDTNISKFKPEDIYNQDKMCQLSLKYALESRFNFVKEVYLEGLCHVAMVDAEASKVCTSIIGHLKRSRCIRIENCPSCFPICIFRRLRGRLPLDEIQMTLMAAVRNHFLSEDEFVTLVSDFNNLTKRGIILAMQLLEVAFKRSRPAIAKQISLIICKSIKKSAKKWVELKGFLDSFFTKHLMCDFDNGRLKSKVWNQQQIEIVEYFLEEFDRIFKGFLQHYLPRQSKTHLQIRQCLSKYCVKPNEDLSESEVSSEENVLIDYMEY